MIDLSTPRNKVLFVSAASSIVVGLATITDLISGYPFHGIVFFDITFLICALLVIFMAYDAWTDLNRGVRRPKMQRGAAAEHLSTPSDLASRVNVAQAWPSSQPGILHPVIRSIPYESAGLLPTGRESGRRKTSVSV